MQCSWEEDKDAEKTIKDGAGCHLRGSACGNMHWLHSGTKLDFVEEYCWYQGEIRRNPTALSLVERVSYYSRLLTFTEFLFFLIQKSPVIVQVGEDIFNQVRLS